MIFNTKYLQGAVKIRVKGPMPERFINLCVMEEITLWGITKTDDDLIAWIRLQDFFRIRPLVICSHTKVKVLARRGLPFIIKRIKQRKMLMVGACIFFVSLYILSSYIWFVEITGLKNISEQEIRYVAEQYGLRTGSGKSAINIKKIEREIPLHISGIAWVGVNFTGTRAVIEVVEKTMPKQEDKLPAHIIAAKDGVITEIIPLNGQVSVKSGDTVKKGDLLIKGITPQPPAVVEGQLPKAAVPAEPIRAKGIIKARVWYESYAETERIQTFTNRTGNYQMTINMKMNDIEMAFNRLNGQPFPEFETVTIYKQLHLWRNSELVVESTITIYREINSQHTEKTFEEAYGEAYTKAAQSVQVNIPETAHILSRNYEVLKTSEENIVRVKVNVETIEDIGQTINIYQ
ncbi:MAG: sporulation protein YqfD [Firmicutes bacterium]|nr:sporulation protein YqfD [Bacillota bacterium]